MMGAARARKLTEYEEESCRREGGWGEGTWLKGSYTLYATPWLSALSTALAAGNLTFDRRH